MKRRVQVVPPGDSIVGLDGQRWGGRMLITARCGHQFVSDSRPCIDLCMSTARLLDHHERLCPRTVVPVFGVRRG